MQGRRGDQKRVLQKAMRLGAFSSSSRLLLAGKFDETPRPFMCHAAFWTYLRLQAAKQPTKLEPVELVDEGSASPIQLIEALTSEVSAAVGFLLPRPAGAFDASVEFGRLCQEFPEEVRNVGDCPGCSHSLIVSHFTPVRDPPSVAALH